MKVGTFYRASLSFRDRPEDVRWWHPPLRAFVGFTVTEWLRARFRVELHGEEYLHHARGALILFNHRRDSDGPILSAILLQRKGLRLHGVNPYIVAREDLFRQGFLSHYLDTWPRPLRSSLEGLSVGPLLRVMRLRPMRRIPEHSLEELLSDILAVLGNLPLKEVLREDCVARFAGAGGREAGDLAVADALKGPRELLSQRRAFRRMRLDALRRLKPFERDTISSQLRAFVELVDAGAAVLLAPEGAVSPDGRFGKPRQALHHLLNVPTRAPHVLPVALSYDALCPGRPRVLVRVGPPRHDLRGLSRRDTGTAAQRVLLDHWMINASHLVAYYWTRVAGGAGEDLPQSVQAFIARMVGRCEALNVPLDPALLDPRTREQRAAECLAFQSRLRQSQGEGLLEFLSNELDSIAAAYPGLLRCDRR